MIYGIPVAARYNPLFQMTKTKEREISIAQAELNRTRNFLLLPRYHIEDAPNTKTQVNLLCKRLEKVNHKLEAHFTNTLEQRSFSVARGLIPYDKQGERKFVFEKSNPVSEQRFTFLNLPKVHSKNKRLTGFIDFKRISPRPDVFPEKPVQGEYEPRKMERRV